jgi:FkbM family methyltransferase
MLQRIKHFFKKIIPANSLVYKVLVKIYYAMGFYWRPSTISNIEDIIEKYATYKKTEKQATFFVQIGANDGVADDPIKTFIKENHWQGLMVEPIAYLFERLKQNYRDFPIQFENSAIASQTGTQIFYRTTQSANLPIWHEMIGSLKQEILQKHQKDFAELGKFLIEEEVKCLTFNDLKEKYKLSKIDFILIDTEGSDAEILQTIDLQELKTEMVIFEHRHLTFEVYKKTLLLLKKQDFQYFRAKYDTVAVHKTLIKRLIKS